MTAAATYRESGKPDKGSMRQQHTKFACPLFNPLRICQNLTQYQKSFRGFQ